MEIDFDFDAKLNEIVSFLNNINEYQIDGENFDFSHSEISKIGIVYFIYVTNKETNLTELKYIGKSRGSKFKNRIKNHFVKPNKGTQTKNDFIKAEWEKENECSFNFIITKPESLRNLLEEDLIKEYVKDRNQLWNFKKFKSKM